MPRHVWEKDEDGYVKYYGDHHAGPWCVACEDTECESCRPEFITEDCPARVAQPTLPGLDYEEV